MEGMLEHHRSELDRLEHLWLAQLRSGLGNPESLLGKSPLGSPGSLLGSQGRLGDGSQSQGTRLSSEFWSPWSLRRLCTKLRSGRKR